MAIIKINGFVVGIEKMTTERIKELENAGFIVVLQ